MVYRTPFDPFGRPADALDLTGDGSICISIPKRFIPFLIGAINPLRWPDLWTGTPGDINRTTGQVENIMAALILGDTCNGQEPCPEAPPCSQAAASGAGGLFCDFLEETMPCIDISDMLKIEDGVLYAINSCCEWVAVGTLEAQEQPPPAETLDPLLPDGQYLSACGRAYAVWTTIVQTVHAIWDHKYDVPWDTIRAVKAASPTNLTAIGVWDAISQAIIADVAFGTDDIFNPIKLQKILCTIEPQLAATTDPLSDGEWDAIRFAFAGYGDAVDLPIRNLYQYTLQYAITRARLSAVAQAGALNDSQDCTCSGGVAGEATSPDSNGWYLSANYANLFQFIVESGSWTVQNLVTTLLDDVFGCLLRIDTEGGSDTVKRMDSDTTLSGYTPPTHDVDQWGNTSDHLEDINQSIPFISQLTDDIQESLAAQAGYIAWVDAGTTGLNETDPNSPPATGGQVLAASLWATPPTQLGSGLSIVEFRFVHNINSPSHSS